jgi:peptidyl-prolyl cis-trans isomerase SurA
MTKKFYAFAGTAVSLLLIGMTAQANKTGVKVLPDDSTKVAVQENKIPENSVVDEVIWVVGDEPILKSDVEVARLQAESDGVKWPGDPDCSIPEELAVQKLFLHQAAIDSIQVTETDVSTGVEQQISRWIQLAGSKEKLEEWRNQSVSEMRQQLHDDYKNNLLIMEMKKKLVEDVAVTPSDVRAYFRDMPADSIPYVPTEVEVEIITRQPKIAQEEINRVKDQLRNFTDRVNKGETTFATLARLYSEDPGTARQGGELGYAGRGTLDPAFANVAFNLTDPKKISKIFESEFGFHIVQLIDRRGDKVNVRHILLKPHVSQEAVGETEARLDSIVDDINAKKFTFEEAATLISDDKDTKNNHGLMAFANQETGTLSPRFRMQDLSTEIAREVEKMKVGDISKAFQMINAKGKTVCAVVKLKNRIDGHKATITEDYQVMKNVVVNKERDKVLHDWVVDKIKHTYVSMQDRYKNCHFEYQGWVK